MQKRYLHLCFLPVMLLMQGCLWFSSPTSEAQVTITFKNGSTQTLHFKTMGVTQQAERFAAFLQDLENGKSVNIDEPHERNLYDSPLLEAIDYALGKSYCFDRQNYQDKNCYLVKYLLEKGANPKLAKDSQAYLATQGEIGKKLLEILDQALEKQANG